MSTNRPNILIIQADQHRFDCLGAYGNPDLRTPHIDGLAAQGVRYANSFCPYPVCTPSRYSFLCGLYVRQHLGGSNHCTLPTGLPTFPRLLRENGYATAAVGKMHFTPTYLDVGFEEMVLAEQNGPGRYEDDYHRWLRARGLIDRIDVWDQEREFREQAPPHYWESYGAMESNLDEAHHSTTWIGDRALAQVERWRPERGNLLMVSFIKPHHPFDPPAPWSQMYAPEDLTLLPGWTEACLPRDLAFARGYFPFEPLSEAQLRRVMAFYYATISHIDHQVGRLIEALRRRDLYDDTLILYNSDHGEFLGFHHLLLKGNYMYDPLVKVPLIVKFPGGAEAGTVCRRLVNSTDVAPTLLRLAGCPIPESMAGLDLRGATERDVIFAEAGRGRQYMARSHTRKLLLCAQEEQSLFFDLEADPLEMENRFEDPVHQAEIEALRERLARWVLFEQTSPVHLDETAPVTRGGNVLRPDDGRRAERMAAARAYVRAQMERKDI